MRLLARQVQLMQESQRPRDPITERPSPLPMQRNNHQPSPAEPFSVGDSLILARVLNCGDLVLSCGLSQPIVGFKVWDIEF